VLAGVEKLRIVPGFTEANALDLYYMPYTHGLPGSILVSLVFGLIVGAFVSERRAEIVLLAATASFSHWILDFIVHTPDLPLYDNSAKVGLGLWRHVMLSFPLEPPLGLRRVSRRRSGLRELRPAAHLSRDHGGHGARPLRGTGRARRVGRTRGRI
jgi:hypothetical protein